MSTLAGGCSCGAVRYELASAPMFVNCCHCRDCQRQTGSAFVINGIIELDRVAVTSATAPEPTRVPTESGRPHDIYRCPTCRVAVWSDYGNRPIRFVRIGTLDEPDAPAVRAGAYIFTRSKLPWVALAPDIPAFDVYYDSATLWSPASLERRRLVFGA